ncbi:MAG TPA: type IV toxin-antitoxin system AbiEi family antitoxin [Thermoleophilaceae bacterium]|nr:type IV toxin-antitoxin system AbiEi family antitoxin [Thermoleophilaceae bacterium]
MHSPQSKLDALAHNPPQLQGGGWCSLDLRDSRHAWLSLGFGDNRLTMSAAYLSVPYPSGLRRLLLREPDLEAVIVDRVPAGLLEAATAADIAILDKHGYGRVVTSRLVYVAPPPRRSAPPSRSGSSPFAPKASRLVRTLLVFPEERWRLSALADVAEVDPGNAHRVLAALMERGLVERDEDEYLVADPGSMLEAWAESTTRPREQLSLPVSGDLADELRVILPVLDHKAVVSGEFAAERLAPHLPAQTALVHCWDRTAWERLGRDTTPKHVPAGISLRGRLIVDLTDEGVARFGVNLGDIPLVHPVQAYVDLFMSPGRGREAGEYLRHESIGF